MTHHSAIPPFIEPLLKRADHPATLAAAFIRSVDAHRPKAAIKPLDGPEITYAELEQQVRQFVLVLRHLDVAAGDRIGVCLPNCAQWAVIVYACAILGVCVVPINIRYRTDELAYAIGQARMKALFTQNAFLSNQIVERLQDIAGGPFETAAAGPIKGFDDLKHIVLIDQASVAGTHKLGELIQRTASGSVDLRELAAERRGTEPLWLFWTSGTTSRPKAALLPQSAVDIVAGWTALAAYADSDRVLTARPLFYIAGQFWCMIGPMLHGACMVIANRFTPDEAIALCRQEKITILSGNPLMFKRILEDPEFDPRAFASVRLGYFGGSTMPLEDMRKIHAAFGFEQFMQTYGMTEFGGFITSTLPSDGIDAACDSCGFPVADVEMKVVDMDSGRPVGAGQVGMLLTRGQKLLRYDNLSPEENARLFDQDGWFITGDLMRTLEDGRFQLVGRLKDLIKVGGENVTAAEIEEKLSGHPGVALVAVIPRKDTDRGEVPVAFIETKSGEPLPEDEIRAWSKRNMAPFKVPAAFHWVRPSDWPMTSSGKIAKHELAQRLNDTEARP